MIGEVKNKPVVTALREIADGQVRFMTEEEKAAHEERERLRAQEAPAPAAVEPKMPIIDFSSIDEEFGAPQAQGGEGD